MLAYIISIRQNVSDIYRQLARLKKLFDKPKPGDESWNGKVKELLTKIEKLCSKAMSQPAPQSLESLNKEYLAGIGHISSMCNLMREGVDNKTPSSVEQGIVEINLGNECFQRVLSKCQKIS